MNAKTQTKRARKAARRAAIRDRLAAAVADIYGNGRVRRYPAIEPDGVPSFFDWLGDYASREIDYMSVENFGHLPEETRAIHADGWRPAHDRLRTARLLLADNPRRYKGDALARAHLPFGFGRRGFERDYRVLLQDAREQLTQPRKRRDGTTGRESAVYSHGRNGKTFAPSFLYDSRGRVDVDALASTHEDRARLVLFVEQFNAYIRSLADDAASVYADEMRERLKEKQFDQRRAMSTARATYHALAAELRTLRGIDAPTACDVLRGRLRSLRAEVRDAAQSLRELSDTLRMMRADGAA